MRLKIILIPLAVFIAIFLLWPSSKGHEGFCNDINLHLDCIGKTIFTFDQFGGGYKFLSEASKAGSFSAIHDPYAKAYRLDTSKKFSFSINEQHYYFRPFWPLVAGLILALASFVVLVKTNRPNSSKKPKS